MWLTGTAQGGFHGSSEEECLQDILLREREVLLVRVVRSSGAGTGLCCALYFFRKEDMRAALPVFPRLCLEGKVNIIEP